MTFRLIFCKWVAKAYFFYKFFFLRSCCCRRWISQCKAWKNKEISRNIECANPKDHRVRKRLKLERWNGRKKNLIWLTLLFERCSLRLAFDSCLLLITTQFNSRFYFGHKTAKKRQTTLLMLQMWRWRWATANNDDEPSSRSWCTVVTFWSFFLFSSLFFCTDAVDIFIVVGRIQCCVVTVHSFEEVFYLTLTYEENAQFTWYASDLKTQRKRRFWLVMWGKIKRKMIVAQLIRVRESTVQCLVYRIYGSRQGRWEKYALKCIAGFFCAAMPVWHNKKTQQQRKYAHDDLGKQQTRYAGYFSFGKLPLK